MCFLRSTGLGVSKNFRVLCTLFHSVSSCILAECGVGWSCWNIQDLLWEMFGINRASHSHCHHRLSLVNCLHDGPCFFVNLVRFSAVYSKECLFYTMCKCSFFDPFLTSCSSPPLLDLLQAFSSLPFQIWTLAFKHNQYDFWQWLHQLSTSLRLFTAHTA